jgi:hypothetical protein
MREIMKITIPPSTKNKIHQGKIPFAQPMKTNITAAKVRITYFISGTAFLVTNPPQR